MDYLNFYLSFQKKFLLNLANLFGDLKINLSNFDLSIPKFGITTSLFAKIASNSIVELKHITTLASFKNL
jgi:hypothetical protein